VGHVLTHRREVKWVKVVQGQSQSQCEEPEDRQRLPRINSAVRRSGKTPVRCVVIVLGEALPSELGSETRRHNLDGIGFCTFAQNRNKGPWL
jgi:hypothetical protein